MRHIYNFVVGVLLIVAAIIGLVFSIGGLFGLQAVQERVQSGLQRQLGLLDQALSATDAGLQTATASVTQSQAILASIGGTVGGSTAAIDDIVPAVETMSEMVGSELPATLEDATQALTTFADTAEVIDRVMTLLGSLPLVNLPAYSPDVTLNESVTNLRDSVDDLGGTLQVMQAGLDKTATNLRDIRGEMSGVGTALDGLADSLNGAVATLSSYQEIMADLAAQLDQVENGLESGLRWARIVATGFLLWFGIASLGLLTLGWDLLKRNRETQPSE